MHNRSPGSFTAGARAGFFVLLAVAMLVLTPRPASAASLICVLGQCQLAPGGCSLYDPLPSMYTCTPTAAMRNPKLARLGKDASLLVDGKPLPIISDALLKIFDRWGNKIPPKNDPNFRAVDREYAKAFDTAFRATDRTVSEERLASIGKELGLPIPPMRSR